MTTALAVVLSQDQQQVYDAMSSAWKTKADKALGMVQNVIRSNVLARHDLGEIVRDLAGDASRYGEAAVPNLAIVLKETPAQLWLCRTFAQTYTRKALETLIERSSRGGHQLAWSHLRLLCGVENSKVRKQLEAAAIEKKYTAEDLATKVQRVQGKRKASGKKHLAPKSPAAALGQINKLTGEVLARASSWDELVFSHFEKAGADQIKDEDIVDMEAAHGRIVSTRKQFERLEQHSEKAIRAMKARHKAGASASSNGHAANGAKIRTKPNTAAILGGSTKRRKPKATKKGRPTKKKAKRRLQTA